MKYFWREKMKQLLPPHTALLTSHPLTTTMTTTAAGCY